MRTRAEWRPQMQKLAGVLERVGRPMLLAEFADEVFPGMKPAQRRNRMGQFARQGWVVAHRVAKMTARYTLGSATWHRPIRIVHRDQQQPPAHAYARLMGLVGRYEQFALRGDDRREAQKAAQGAREMAAEYEHEVQVAQSARREGAA